MSDSTLPQHTQVFIVGAGFGGIGLAVKLKEAGYDDFVVAEKGHTVGGTWRDNTYPGAACDVPSQLYSFSFALNKSWSRSFSPQAEILRYLEKVTDDAGVRDHFRFGVEVHEMRWDETDNKWHISTSAGDSTADVLLVAAGSLSAPKLPDIEGIDSFGGEIWHSARWNHDYDLAGKRVAVIGTGASAIQLVPEIAPVVAHLDVYQRSAPWVIPRHDRTYGKAEATALKRVPGLNRVYRNAIRYGRETYIPGFTWLQQLSLPFRKQALHNIKVGATKPGLPEKVTPTFDFGCKRVLISNTWYPTLSRDNVDLVTDPITKVTATGIVTADGVEHPVDAIVVATGFHTTDHPIADRIYGRRKLQLAEHWRWHGASAYKGTTVPGFPNLFQITGPNTVLGHSSMIEIIEAQIGYIISALDWMKATEVIAVEPKENLTIAYNHNLQVELRKTVWNKGGCSSWYLDEVGRNTIIWPKTTMAYRKQVATFDGTNYNVTDANLASHSH